MPVFAGTPEDHMRQYHPNPATTFQERRDLERRLAAAWLPLYIEKFDVLLVDDGEDE